MSHIEHGNGGKIQRSDSDALLLTIPTVQQLVSHQKTHITLLEANGERLSDLNIIQERANRDLKGATERLNWTLNVIMTYENFPVKMFCPGHGE